MLLAVGGAARRADIQPPKAPVPPEELFRQADSAGKGFITESDLASAIVKISAEGMSLSLADAEAMAREAFKVLDSDQNGKMTQEEFMSAAGKVAASRLSAKGAAPEPHGGPPRGGPPAAAAAQDTSTSYDPADTNQDGTVSPTERAVYATKHPDA